MADTTTPHTALLTALATEHFVQQSAISATISEMASRTTIYIMSLSSALVATGFVAQSPEFLQPFLLAVLPSLFLLGSFTVLRLIDIAAENMQAHIGIARIRAYYRTLGDDAAFQFSKEFGRWPENDAEPSLRSGPLLAHLTTAATMIAFVNGIVAAAGVTLLALYVGSALAPALCLGAGTTTGLMILFYWYQRLRTKGMVRLAKAYGPEKSVL
ncbi:hypothetical protein [Mesorhizobium sp.]|uniref:hypothetical protein n=1 Tax=Mesorhizobium sp. TaxID=1871066 RepID=UPI000FE542EB|nr:hypothetical protein [Mesorhizobium sp.]RWP48920.1 MAG: hypothetical protein EOR05_12715 [Mesorhizobium sp.]RWQ63614.1 MAG: hypothetical protein EOS86_24005 [Mesorhizobium sp.]